MIYQYYYHNNECKAYSAESKDCICWHDEGTDPFVNERHDHKNRRIYNLNLLWRVKPDELADLKLRCEEQQQKLDEMAKAFSQQQDRIKRLEDCAETAWGIIANVDSGSWQEQRADWREAATRWRDEQFHPELSEHKAKEAKP